ncbi:hypothetical protein SBF1_2420014 [Candidatus Desulfosporosinus infrequens]|uniref:Uncharacterized protein n=1 Tax=Candidatus Desulfosporosinus infrequens TaxID=2043169 RepID=A0A2U3KN99_9FIRM|nr:hypothetical protein SBF1_2420014 [Candidatus Desulfosporosinus infrequens]
MLGCKRIYWNYIYHYVNSLYDHVDAKNLTGKTSNFLFAHFLPPFFYNPSFSIPNATTARPYRQTFPQRGSARYAPQTLFASEAWKGLRDVYGLQDDINMILSHSPILNILQLT